MTFNPARHDSAAGHFEDFCLEHGSDVGEAVLSMICEAAWAGKTVDGVVRISDVHKHDAINKTISGTVEVGDVEYGFVIEDGNWNGTVIREWGLAENVDVYEPPKPDPWNFFPLHAENLRINRPAMWKLFLAWRNGTVNIPGKPLGWFSDTQRSYNYDLHFAPGGKTASYYRDIGAPHSLVWRKQSEVDAFIARPDSDFENKPSVAVLVQMLNEGVTIGALSEALNEGSKDD